MSNKIAKRPAGASLRLITRSGSVVPAERPGTLFSAFTTVTYQYGFSAFVSYALFYLLARGQAREPSRLGWLLSWRLWRPLATLSYSAYLLHPLVILPLWVVWFRMQPDQLSVAGLLAVGGLALVCTFGVAYLLFMTVEHPFMQFERKLSSRLDSLPNREQA
jgi:peptidoglycan/LPS O-acetylase OafA/YrhL